MRHCVEQRRLLGMPNVEAKVLIIIKFVSARVLETCCCLLCMIKQRIGVCLLCTVCFVWFLTRNANVFAPPRFVPHKLSTLAAQRLAAPSDVNPGAVPITAELTKRRIVAADVQLATHQVESIDPAFPQPVSLLYYTDEYSKSSGLYNWWFFNGEVC